MLGAVRRDALLKFAFGLVLSMFLGVSAPVLAQTAKKPPAPAAPAQSAGLPILRKSWTGDYDAMVKRRLIRVLVPHSKTMYFVEMGQPRGIAYEALKAFEDEINKKRGNLKVNVVFFPTTRDQMGKALLGGLGDIVVAGVTVTAEREKFVDFTIPTTTKPINEIVVTGPQSPQLTSIDDLAGKEVFVRKTSSYWTHLEHLNARFKKEGKAAITLRAAPEDLEDEDLLEMLNAGLFGIAVVDDYKLELWSKIFPKIKSRPDLTVSTGGELAWAIRPNSPQLKAALDAFLKTHRQGTTFGNTLLKRYIGNPKFVADARSPAEMKKFQAVVDLFRKYSGRYNVDFLLMMAQGYQESRLQSAGEEPGRRHRCMQVMPATGKELAVGDVKQLDPNIHAGVKYMRFMIDRYYKDEPMDAPEQGAVHVCLVQRRPGQDSSASTGSGGARPEPKRLVQQRRDRRLRKDWARNGDVRRQHLQVLRRVQVGGRDIEGDKKKSPQ